MKLKVCLTEVQMKEAFYCTLQCLLTNLTLRNGFWLVNNFPAGAKNAELLSFKNRSASMLNCAKINCTVLV